MLSFLIASLMAVSVSAAQPAQQVLKGHVPAITKRLKPTGRLDAGRQLHLVLGLPLRNREQLTNLLEELYDPNSANFRHFLKPDEFTTSFGPSRQDYQAIIDFANAHHFKVKTTHANRTMVDVVASVADIEEAFHIHMQVYNHPTEKRTFFSPDVEPTVDSSTPLLAISGLDNYVTPRPMIRPAIKPLGGGTGGGGGSNGGSGSGGSYLGYDFRDAYTPGITNGGEGQSVALFELTGYDPQDISDYESAGNLPGVPLQNILIDGFDGDDTNIQYAIECTADIEMCVAMAPNLQTIYVFEGPTPLYDAPLGTNATQYAFTTAEINDVLDAMATDTQHFANQISCSYQMDVNLTTSQIFQQYAAQGQSFFQASGDSGAFPAAIDEPSDNPYITVVGGTTLSTSSSAWSSETTWLSPPGTDSLGDTTPFEASGGGFSLTYPIPWWQQGISMTANQGSTTMRNLPDVALIANNIDVWWGEDEGLADLGLNDLGGQAGTSFSAPLWASFMALVNQQAAANGQPPVGFVNPALYAIGKSASYHSCFHDITTGKNTNNASPTKFYATAGYDLCTGWGTIIGTNLMQALLQPPKETLLITPPLGFTSFGPGGGPYSVTSQTYTLKNIGAQPLSWTATKDSSWLNLSANSGALNPGASTTVTVSLNSTVSNLLIATVSGNVSFANLTDGTAQNRQFDLHVGNGGFETGDLTDWTFVGSTNLTFALAGDDVDVAGTNALDGEPDELFVHSGLWGGYLGEWPDNGSLSQTLSTKAGQQLLVSFWLTSVPDNQGNTTPNGFAAKWNGSTLYMQTNLPAFGWTNLQFVVTGGASSTLAFQFNNSPGAFGLDDIFVGSIPAPVFESAAVRNGNITFSWAAYPTVTYQIQSATNLANNTWTNVGSAITATNNSVSATEAIGAAPQRFYRLEIVPGH
ncbi:MAG TPA: protease pro-enzyme activation domain-containing protein [Verrucomicrobiae bacterium]|nr:protease pro-enzyme activation domain-containing protein [Verrucomicrobiae bacterium]